MLRGLHLIMDYKPSELREIEYQYCRTHLEYFVETYGHIEDKDAEELIQPFNLWEDQRKALRQFRDNKLNVILKARQLGITWLVLHYALWKMINPGRTVIGLSRTEDEAQELVRRMSVILDNMREERHMGKYLAYTHNSFPQSPRFCFQMLPKFTQCGAFIHSRPDYI